MELGRNEAAHDAVSVNAPRKYRLRLKFGCSGGLRPKPPERHEANYKAGLLSPEEYPKD